VLGDRSGGLDLEDIDLDADPMTEAERLDTIARELGRAVAIDDDALIELLPDLSRGGSRAHLFGCGLAEASDNPRATWMRLVEGLDQVPADQRGTQMLRGYLARFWEQDQDTAQDLLDAAFGQSSLLPLVPELNAVVPIDSRGVDRLKRALGSDQVPIWSYRALAAGRATDQLSGPDLRDILLLIAQRPHGHEIALDILRMRFASDRSGQRAYEAELLQAGRELLRHLTFTRRNQNSNHNLAAVAQICLAGSEGAPLAHEIAGQLTRAVAKYEIFAFDCEDLLAALLRVHPEPVLDAIFGGDEGTQKHGQMVFEDRSRHRQNPADEIPCEILIAWCDQDRQMRYPLAASFVTFARRPDQSGPRVWSEHAIALLAHAPDPRSVLAAFVGRFRPMSYSGSLAVLIEANTVLLDSLPSEFQAEGLAEYVIAAKAQLARMIAAERQRETDRDRERDERFE